MGLDSSVGLIVATLDLQLVRMLRRAMQGGGGPPQGLGPAPAAAPRPRANAEPVIEPRPRVRPEPAVEPRPMLRGSIGAHGCAPFAQIAPAAPAESATAPSSPLEPPWKVLPWEPREFPPPPRPLRRIKVVVARPDSYCKGSVLDLFI